MSDAVSGATDEAAAPRRRRVGPMAAAVLLAAAVGAGGLVYAVHARSTAGSGGAAGAALSPPHMDGPLLAYDATRHQTLLIGSMPGSRSPMRTWAWDGSAWSELHPAHQPPGRLGGGFAWDATDGVLVLAGGTTTGPRPMYACAPSTPCPTPGQLTDTWTWDGADWTEQHPTHHPLGGLISLVTDPSGGAVGVVRPAGGVAVAAPDPVAQQCVAPTPGVVNPPPSCPAVTILPHPIAPQLLRWDGHDWVTGPPAPPTGVLPILISTTSGLMATGFPLSAGCMAAAPVNGAVVPGAGLLSPAPSSASAVITPTGAQTAVHQPADSSPPCEATHASLPLYRLDGNSWLPTQSAEIAGAVLSTTDPVEGRTLLLEQAPLGVSTWAVSPTALSRIGAGPRILGSFLFAGDPHGALLVVMGSSVETWTLRGSSWSLAVAGPPAPPPSPAIGITCTVPGPAIGVPGGTPASGRPGVAPGPLPASVTAGSLTLTPVTSGTLTYHSGGCSGVVFQGGGSVGGYAVGSASGHAVVAPPPAPANTVVTSTSVSTTSAGG